MPVKQVMRPVSVVVPTLNEVENLPILFERIDKTLKSAQIPYEILVVDDHSDDGSDEFVLKVAKKYNARLLKKIGQRGKAFSLIEGFKEAKYDLICMIDADLQYPPESIKHMYHKLQYLEADIVVTNRQVNQTSLFRKLSTHTFNLIFTRLLFGIKYDTQSGLKLFRKEVLNTVNLSPSAWTFDLEFIVKSLQNNYVVVSQDIVFSERYSGVPKIKMFDATLEIAGGSIKLWRNTSKRNIKLRYKHMETIQSKAWFIGIVAACVLALSAVAAPRTSALGLTKSQNSAASSLSEVKNASLDSDLQQMVNNVVSSIDGSSSSSSDTAPSTSPTSPTTTANQSTATSQSTTNTSSTSTKTSLPTSTNATSSPSKKSDTTANSTSSNTPLTDSDIKSTTTKPTTLTSASANNSSISSNTNGKTPSYYKSNKLSQHTTSTLITVAQYVIYIALVMLALGVLIARMNKRLKRTHTQLLEN
jgi:glycosyltransferase involved in cell wall biosynthesis